MLRIDQVLGAAERDERNPRRRGRAALGRVGELDWTWIGIVIGIGAAFGLTRLISSQLYGVTATDPLTISVVVLLLTAIAMLACVIPARNAANAEPLRALRVE